MPNNAPTLAIAKAQDAYDRQAATRDPTCGHGCVMLVNEATEQITIRPVTCKRWSCSYCAPQKLRRYKWIGRAGHPERHIVLTLRAEPEKPTAEMVAFIRDSFKKLVARIRREYKAFEYLCGLELTKNNTPHLHVLQRGSYIPHSWLSKNWQAITGSYICHIKAVTRTAASVNEMTKYLAKTASEVQKALPRFTPVTMSRGWIVEKPEADPAHSEDDWIAYYYRVSLADLRRALQSMGTDLVTARSPPGTYTVPPDSFPSNETIDEARQRAFHEQDRALLLACNLCSPATDAIHAAEVDTSYTPDDDPSLRPPQRVLPNREIDYPF